MARLSGNRQLVYGMLIAFALVACAGATFPFKHYGISVPPECYDRGTLLGAKPADDLSLKVCAPVPGDSFKCAVLQTPEFQRLKKSHLKLQSDLAQCQRDLAAHR